MTDLLLNYALKFPVDAELPAVAGSSGAVSGAVSGAESGAESLLPLDRQPVSPAAAPEPHTHTAAHSSPSAGH